MRIREEITVSSETPPEDDPRKCPFCGEISDDCPHSLAGFGTTEGVIAGGLLFQHEDDLWAAFEHCVKATSENRCNVSLPEPLLSVVGEIVSAIREDSRDSWDDRYWDARAEHLRDVLSALQDVLGSFEGVQIVRYAVDEGSGTWGYADYYSPAPEQIVHTLLAMLRGPSPADDSSPKLC